MREKFDQADILGFKIGPELDAYERRKFKAQKLI